MSSLISSFVIPIVVLAPLALLSARLRALREGERTVACTSGRFPTIRGSEFVPLLPFVQQMVRADLRSPIRADCARPRGKPSVRENATPRVVRNR